MEERIPSYVREEPRKLRHKIRKYLPRLARRRRRRHRDGLPRKRMRKREAVGIERKGTFDAAAVLAVAEERMPDGRELRTDLVEASGQKFYRKQGRFPSRGRAGAERCGDQARFPRACRPRADDSAFLRPPVL